MKTSELRLDNLSNRHRFTAWDGEGAMINGKHEYILLQNNMGDYIANTERGLSTVECLDFIAAHSIDGNLNVMFGLSYDANMILRDVPKNSLQRMWGGHDGKGYTYFNKYVLGYTHRKLLTIKLLDFEKTPKPHVYRNLPKFTTLLKDAHLKSRNYPTKKLINIWEVVGFFQTTFLKAVQKYLPETEGIAQIEEWKQRRPTFQVSELDEIRSYCLLECQLLVRLMETLDLYLDEAGITLRRWDGAGAIAGAMIREHNVNIYHGEHEDDIWRMAQIAYGGGRVEMPRYGFTRKTCTVLDINSAYPSAMPLLPSLRAGEWQKVDTFEPDTFGLWSVEWAIKPEQLIYPFFYRQHNDVRFTVLPIGQNSGKIIYPAVGRGVYWTPEIQAAIDIHGPSQVHIMAGYVWRPYESVKPLAWVRDLYRLRKQWKMEGNGAEYVLKLGMNSLYGKMAQQLGGREGRPPSSHQLMWAGYITAHTRAQLYRVAKANEKRLIYLATDGIGLEGPPENQVLPVLGEDLGQWSMKTADMICAVQAGVYFTFEGGQILEPKEKIRGFDRGSLKYGDILNAWIKHKRYIEVPSTRFITLGTALSGPDRWPLWRSWHTIQRKLQIDPAGTKRTPMYPLLGRTQGHFYADAEPWNMLVDTKAARNVTPKVVSKEYPIAWLGEARDELLIDGTNADEYNREWDEMWM